MKREDLYIRDPFVFIENGVCYLIGTTDVTCWGGKAKGFLGFTSTDLENFEGPFTLFEKTDDFWADENFWAPELHKYNNKYYIVASFYKQGKSRACQILECDEVFGTYKPLSKPFTPEDWWCLDGTLYEENGILYTVFSHEWMQIKNGEIVCGKINKTFDGLEDKPITLFKATDAPWVVSHTESKDDFITDGPFLYKLSSGKLLMLWSSAGKDGYAMGEAVSENGIKGPWRHIETPIFSKDGGHGMIFKFKNKTYISLHSPNGPHLAERPVFFEVEEKEDCLVIKQ